MKKFLITLCFSIFAQVTALDYTVYLESWDSQYQNAYQGVVTNSDSQYQNYSGTTVNISFAAFYFQSLTPPYVNPSGLYGTSLGGEYYLQDSAVTAIINFVQAHQGKVQIAYGGNSYAYPYAPNYFISQTADWPNNISYLAQNVASVINFNFGGHFLDGVDFDIEDPQPSTSTPQQFAQQLTQFLQQVRANLLPGKTITLTIPGQGWGTYWQYLAQNVAAIDGLVDAINFMEYDIWINSGLANGYVEQVEADIITYTSPTNEAPGPNYSQGWGIPPELIQIGIMPGNDDTQQLMTTAGAAQLTQFAIDSDLPGVFIWDIDRDAQTVMTPTPFYTIPGPYAYTNAIRTTILQADPRIYKYSTRSRTKRFVNYETVFQRQPPPPHGQP